MTSITMRHFTSGKTVFTFKDWTATDYREVRSISFDISDPRTDFYAVMVDGTDYTITNKNGVKTAMVDSGLQQTRHMYQLKDSADFSQCYETRNEDAETRLQAAFMLLQSVITLIDEGDCFLEW
jgi:hypothetical protein